MAHRRCSDAGSVVGGMASTECEQSSFALTPVSAVAFAFVANRRHSPLIGT